MVRGVVGKWIALAAVLVSFVLLVANKVLVPPVAQSQGESGIFELRQGVLSGTDGSPGRLYNGSIDTYIDRWFLPNKPHGNDETLALRAPDIRSILIRYRELPPLPPGTQVQQATLEFFSIAPAPNNLSIRTTLLLHEWDPETADWHSAAKEQPWGQAGASGTEDVGDQAVGIVTVPARQPSVQLDVSEAVRLWYESPGTNYGLLISAFGSVATEYRFISNDSRLLDLRPRLTIVYGPPIPTPTRTATPTAIPTKTPLPPRSYGHYMDQFQQGRAGYDGTSDTFITAWGPVGVPNGASARLEVRQGNIKNTLIRFELPQFSPGAVLSKATLVLDVATCGNCNPMSAQVYEVLRPWDASKATFQLTGLGIEQWGRAGATAPGIDRAESPVTVVLLPRQFDSSGVAPVELDITPLVRKWLVSPDTNHGLLISGGGDVSVEYSFVSSEDVVIERRPLLRIESEIPTPMPTEIPTGTPTGSPTPRSTPTLTSTPTDIPTLPSTVTPTPPPESALRERLQRIDQRNNLFALIFREMLAAVAAYRDEAP
ncbi:MAG TPA: hypothetical protein DEP84_19605 [Chloroflexi bacterium]|nr:hypothetical protein [Chloroflexota bacterium]